MTITIGSERRGKKKGIYMKNSKTTLLVILALVAIVGLVMNFASCDKETGSKPTANVKLHSFTDSLSYALGYLNGSDIAETGYPFNYDIMHKGLVNAQSPDIMILSEIQVDDLLQRFFAMMMADRKERNQAEGIAYMALNGQDPDVTTTESGLQYKVLKSSNGRQVTAGSSVTAHYIIKLVDGDIYDNSYERNQPQTFQVDEVIPGWSEGLKLMKVGEIYELVLPDSLAFGDAGREPGAYIIIETEVLSVTR